MFSYRAIKEGLSYCGLNTVNGSLSVSEDRTPLKQVEQPGPKFKRTLWVFLSGSRHVTLRVDQFDEEFSLK